MERLKQFLNTFIITVVLLTSTTEAFAESPYKKNIYIAFINRDMTKWSNVIQSIEKSDNTNTVEQKLELINYYYGYIGYLIGIKQFEPAEKLLTKGEKLIKQVLHDSPNNATAYSFKGTFIGFDIGINRYKAVYLGTESSFYVNKALKIDPENIQALIDKGNILYYAPRLLGGDKKEALVYFIKGVKIIEKNKDTFHNWVYLNLLSIIASAYEKTDNLKEAKLTYEKIIRNEPDIKWVKEDLYPNLLAKIKS